MEMGTPADLGGDFKEMSSGFSIASIGRSQMSTLTAAIAIEITFLKSSLLE